MSSTIRVRKEFLVVLASLGVAALIVRLLLPLLVRPPEVLPHVARPRWGGHSPLILPEARPSSGIGWSKRHYPEQYDPPNRRTVQLFGIDDFQNERFLDVGSRAYSKEFLSKFSYIDPAAARPQVRVEYLRRAETFVGKLTARGLKPNFAYQLKLRGLFSDRESFERIGYLGRWRLPGSLTNYGDSAYEGVEHKELVESYLFFDFVVTDSSGNAEKEFYADSTLHVLWNASYQRQPQGTDTQPVEVRREGSDPALYANPFPDLSPQQVFAQSEEDGRGRPPVGMAFLPPGHYRAEFVLTEESFHEYADGGFWVTVMGAPAEFDVLDNSRPSLYWKSGTRVSPLALDGARTENLRATTQTQDLLEGVAVTNSPRIVFGEEIDLPAGERYFLSAEVKAGDPYELGILIDTGQGFDTRQKYYVRAESSGEWRRFEVEITSRAAGKKVRVRLDPTPRVERMGVRRVGVYKVED